MLKRVGDLTINSVILRDGVRYFVIDKDQEMGMALIQSECGQITDNIHLDIEVDVIAEVPQQRIRGFEPVSAEGIANTKANFESKGFICPDSCVMPLRGSKVSAGYDLSTPVDITIPAGGKVKIFTNVKAYMQVGEVLFADVRSSVGINDDVVLANVIGVIDMDYHNNPKNEGNIGLALKNTGSKDVTYKAGERVCQLIFLPFLVSDNCNTEADRVGGLGSTGR